MVHFRVQRNPQMYTLKRGFYERGKKINKLLNTRMLQQL